MKQKLKAGNNDNPGVKKKTVIFVILALLFAATLTLGISLGDSQDMRIEASSL